MHILPEHKKKYLQRRIEEIEQLNAGLNTNNLDVAISIGHRLKGNGETFGYPDISAIGIAMENAAHQNNKVEVKEQIDKLKIVVERGLKEIE